MSQLLTTKNNTFVNTTKAYVIENKELSTYQTDLGTAFTPPTVLPGEPSVCSVILNSRDVEQNIAHFFKYDVKNSSATRSITFKNGCFSHFDNITITINNSPDSIELKSLEQINQIVSDSYLNEGLNIIENTQFERNEFDTFSGVTIPAGESRTFYYPLNRFVSFAKQYTQGQINNIRFAVRTTPVASNAKMSGVFCSSSDTGNAYNVTDIQYQNLKYIRQYALIPAGVREPLFATSNYPLRYVQYSTVTKTFTGPFTKTAGNSATFKLSDVTSRKNVQYLSLSLSPNASAYNSAVCQKSFSGANHILYKTRELFGQNRVIDMTDERILKAFEREQYRNDYGQKQLPLAVWNNSTYELSEYFLKLTRLTFDYTQQLPGESEIIRKIDSINYDWDIEVYPNSDAGTTDCDLKATVVYAEVFNIDTKTGLMTKINA